MQAGKLPPEQLKQYVLGRFARRRPDVLVSAGLGEDCAVIDFGNDVCVISTDPITGAGEGAGRLAVHVACNDVAANGAQPVGVQIALLLPVGSTGEDIARIMDEAEQGCRELEIEVLGGHTEITSKVTAVVIVVTAVGRAAKQRYVTSAGVKPGNDVLITKGVGIEGTAILAADWADSIRQAAQREKRWMTPAELDALLDRARRYRDELSAVRDGVLAAGFGVTAMHDVTEGGLYGALYEIGQVSDCAFRIYEERVCVRPETRFICDCLGLDPYGLISSGTMLIACVDGSGLAAHLSEGGVPAYVIGRAVPNDAIEQGMVGYDGMLRPLPLLREDELWRFLAEQS